MARADNDQVNHIHDLKDKIIAAASISGLGSGQMQFLEMQKAGMNYINGTSYAEVCFLSMVAFRCFF